MLEISLGEIKNMSSFPLRNLTSSSYTQLERLASNFNVCVRFLSRWIDMKSMLGTSLKIFNLGFILRGLYELISFLYVDFCRRVSKSTTLTSWRRCPKEMASFIFSLCSMEVESKFLYRVLWKQHVSSRSA